MPEETPLDTKSSAIKTTVAKSASEAIAASTVAKAMEVKTADTTPAAAASTAEAKTVAAEVKTDAVATESKAAAATSAAAASTAEVKTAAATPVAAASLYEVIMTDIGASRLAVVKEVQTSTGLGLKEAKDLAESAPPVKIKGNISKGEADNLKDKLTAAGAKAEVRPVAAAAATVAPAAASTAEAKTAAVEVKPVAAAAATEVKTATVTPLAAVTPATEISKVSKTDLITSKIDTSKLEKVKSEDVIAVKPPATTVPAPDPTPPPKDPSPSGDVTSVGEFYADIADILTSLGKGLASAQHELDKGALETQRMIMEDDDLSNYGLTATWFVMPEAEFTLKMEMTSQYQETLEGTGAQPRLRLLAAMSNAKFNSLYKSDNKQESSLRVRFVPVPMPALVKVPDLKGLTVAAARIALAGTLVQSSFVDESGKIWDSDYTGTVVAQTIHGGDMMLADKVLMVTVRDTTFSEGAKTPDSAETKGV